MQPRKELMPLRKYIPQSFIAIIQRLLISQNSKWYRLELDFLPDPKLRIVHSVSEILTELKIRGTERK